MLKSLGRQVLQVLITIVLVTIVVFTLQHLVPGGPALAILGDTATAERIDALNEQLGLNQPLVAQYADWIFGLLRGDMGASVVNGFPVSSLIGERLGATLSVSAAGMLVSIVVGVPLGVAAALNRDRPADGLITGLATLGVAVPSFWLGMILVLIFAIGLQMLPATGFVSFSTDPLAAFRHLVLPALALGAVGAAEISRQLRSAMIDVLQTDFIRTHKAKGLPWRRIVWKHAMKNSGIPLATIIGLRVSALLGATIVVETLFAIPGLGTLATTAISNRDYPVIQGIVLVTALFVVVTNLVVDVVYRLLDPRIGNGVK